MTIFISSFTPEKGTREYYFAVEPDKGSSFADQLLSVFSLYKTGLGELNMGLESGIYMNIYIPDAGSEEDVVRKTPLVKALHKNRIAVSVIEQPPLFSKVAILAYHIAIEGNSQKKFLSLKNGGSGTGILIRNNQHTLYFLKGLTSTDSSPVRIQTSRVFDILSSFCKYRGIPYKNIIRTWLYLRDIHRDYQDMVFERSRIFSECGIARNGRFPASTGIGGRNKDPVASLMMDAIIIDGVRDQQLQKMEAITHMSPATDYGVTFERGLRVIYGDREHLYISGTASIDDRGNILHRYDVVKQTERTLENMRMLLGESSSSMDNIAYLVIYLKHPEDKEKVLTCLRKNLSLRIPCLLLQADVCRPEWLIEIEGIAVSEKNHPQFDAF